VTEPPVGRCPHKVCTSPGSPPHGLVTYTTGGLVRAGWADLTLRPMGRFIKAYFIGGDILGGKQGFIQAVLGAYAGFLKYAYLWARAPK